MTRPEDVALDPAILTWAHRIAELSAGMPELHSPIGPARRRAALALSDALAREFTLPAPSTVAIEDTVLHTSVGARRARRYRPENLSSYAPTQLFLHGGGFYAGSISEVLNDGLCAHLADAAGIQIFSLEYRLAPEHPFPAAIDDACASLEALATEASLFGVDITRLGIGGNSAGASIAASTALRLRDQGGPPIVHQSLEVIPAALAPTGVSAIAFAEGFGLDDAAALVEIYLGPGVDVVDAPLASPLTVVDLSGLPPTLIMVAEFDPLRDSGIAYAERLRQAHVPCTLVVGAGHLHGTPGLTRTFPAAQEWQERHARELANAYSTSR